MTAKTKNRVQPAAAGRLNSRAELEKPSEFPLLKHNFKLMAIAALVIVVGFLLMLGPGSSEEAFNILYPQNCSRTNCCFPWLSLYGICDNISSEA